MQPEKARTVFAWSMCGSPKRQRNDSENSSLRICKRRASLRNRRSIPHTRSFRPELDTALLAGKKAAFRAAPCGSSEPRLASDARRFESGTVNAAGIAGLDAAISIVLELGRQTVEATVLGHAAELQQLLISRGLRVLRSSNAGECSGIVITSTGDRGADAAVYERLIARDVRCSLRVTGIRFSPHYYNTAEHLRQAAAAIDPIVSQRRNPP
jgi:cysteine sulfinate desulfinase/cysteine desulfurase-like protein